MSAFGAFTVVRASQKRVLGPSGTLVTYANNEPAFEFNTDGTYRGLLVEPAGTNLALRSEEFNTTWTASGTPAPVITANTTVAPDGATTADTVVMTSPAVSTRLAQNVTFGATTHTFSVWAISLTGSSQIIRLFVFDGTTETNSANLTVGTTWTRLSYTVATAAGSGAISIRAGSAFENVNVALWGAQLEAGSVATSYIPTVASTANRTADSVTLTGASSLIGQSEGTIFIEHQPILSTGTVSRQVITISDNTANNRVRLVYQSFGSPLRYRLVSTVAQGGSATYELTEGNAGGLTTGNIEKLALAYKNADYATYRNGVAVVGTDTGTGTLTSIASSEIDLGQVQDNTIQLNGWIRSVALFPSRLSNAQLASLTTP